MKYSHAIILTIILVVVFCVFFGWCLYNSCSRAINAEFQEPTEHKDIEAQVAAASGATLIWLALFCVHRYIHLSCLELDRWFDLIASRQPEANTCYYDRDIGWDGHTKLRSRSSKRERGGGRSEHAKFRKRYPAQDIESLQSKDAEAKWLGQRGGKKAKLILPTSVPVQGQWQEQQIYPSLGWQGYALGCGEVVNPQPILYPKTTTFPQMAMAMPEPAHQRSRYHEPYAETCSDTSKDNRPMKPAAKSEHRFPRERRVNEVDYIHICDEYPSIVKEGLKKSASATLSSSSCSTDASGSTLEMPRATIPQATRRFADTVPFQLPDYPHLVSRARYAPTSYPRQWMGRGTGGRAANAGVRYAPFTGMSRQVDLHANSRRQAPSNAAP
ncbi:hypothetical protein BKA66DRAFT_422597 [Pyrenochaeta sp. MPI-SDFR-AT-0127]|nr:hypothetical protein BKA66DRAFT_422597 [Pyrenochaeta sp. MPI-SDFR-AT-0127]